MVLGTEQKNTLNKNPRQIVYALVFLILVVSDQAAKASLSHPFLNRDFAFSLPLPQWLIFSIYVIVMLFIVRHCIRNYKNFTTGQNFGWIFILAGGLSNITERILTGYVKDYIYFFNGVFNLADIYIIMGMLILLFFGTNNRLFQREKKP